MGKEVKRGKFKSGRIWKEPRAPAVRRILSKSLKTKWQTKMSLKASMIQIKLIEKDMKLARQEKIRIECQRLAARKKQKEENRLKELALAKTLNTYSRNNSRKQK
ncbi:hypothetical protein LOD99_10119 [Oopsacas minuta]|uniref:rRNA-processing protein n=1 Tax=Oopsacas minuta TaxID=111878 RepID=A0AAV7KMP2_9METZ|nr:hypothetical protein LOD99_10119 [Oopsacas minuta]